MKFLFSLFLSKERERNERSTNREKDEEGTTSSSVISPSSLNRLLFFRWWMNNARRSITTIIPPPAEMPIVFALAIFFNGCDGGDDVAVLIGGINLQAPISN